MGSDEISSQSKSGIEKTPPSIGRDSRPPILSRAGVELGTVLDDLHRLSSSSSDSPLDVSTVDRQQKEISQLRTEKADMAAQYEMEKIRLLERLQEVMNENADLRSGTDKESIIIDNHREELSRRNDELSNQLDILATELMTAERANRELKSDLLFKDEMAERIDALENGNFKLLELLKRRDEERKSLEQKVRHLEMEKADELKRALELQSASAEKLEMDYSSKIESVKRENDELVSSIRMLEDQLSNLVSNNESANVTVAKYEEQLNDLLVERDELAAAAKPQNVLVDSSSSQTDNLIDDTKEEMRERIDYLEETVLKLQDLKIEVRKLKEANHELNNRIKDKDQVILKVNRQNLKRLDEAEASRKELNIQVINLTDEKEKLVEELEKLQKQLPRNLSNIPSDYSVDSDEDLHSVRDKLLSVMAERDSLLANQESLTERHIMQVNERAALEQELEELRSEMQQKIDELTAGNPHSPSLGARVQPSADVHLESQRLRTMLADSEELEKENSERISKLQIRLNETLTELDALKAESERMQREAKIERESAELRLLKLAEEKDKQIADRNRELRTMQKSHMIYANFKKEMNSRRTRFDNISEEPMSSELLKKTPALPEDVEYIEPEVLHEDVYTSNGSSLSDLEKSEAMLGNPLEAEVDMSKFRLPSNYRLPMDVPTLHDKILRLLASIQHLRKTILEQQPEIDGLRKENLVLVNDVKYLRKCLEVQRENYDRSVDQWEELLAVAEAEMFRLRSTDEDMVEKLKEQLEFAKQDWSEVILQKERLIYALDESKSNIVREFYELYANGFNRMHTIMEKNIGDSQKVESTFLLLNLREHRKDVLAAQFFGDLELEFEKRFGTRRYERDDLPSREFSLVTSPPQRFTTDDIPSSEVTIRPRRRRRWSLW